MTPLAVALLAAVLVVAVVRPLGLPEATVAAPAAVVVVLAGLLPLPTARVEVVRLAPTVGFLAAVLVLAHLADAEGVFTWAGGLLGRGRHLFGRTFGVATATTVVLSLDATVVLLTPVVVRTARRRGEPPEPTAYACAHLANSASLLLPVSNLTNLLAVGATGLSFAGFAGLMVLPWLAVLVVEYLGLRWVFRRELRGPAPTLPTAPGGQAPVAALVVLGLTLVGFGGASLVGVEPVVVAVAGAAVLAGRALARGSTTPRRLVASAAPLFCVFVLALGVVVAAVGSSGLGTLLAAALPAGDGFVALLGVASLAAVLAAVVNNLPATLLLLAVLGPAAPTGAVLAVLIGVGVGPNLTYVGSLATLLWRRVLLAEGLAPSPARFTLAGLVTTPVAIVGGVAALTGALALR